MSEVKTTKHTQLQATLNRWYDQLLQVNELRQTQQHNLAEVHRKIDEFARSFVPLDIDEEDISHYTNNLLMDEVERHVATSLIASNSRHVWSGVFRRFGARIGTVCYWGKS
jgi:hypothetical protein